MEHEWYHDVFLDDAFKVYLCDAQIVSNDKNIGNFKDLRYPLYTQIHTVINALPTVFGKDDLVSIVPLFESTEKLEPLTKLKRLIGNVGLKTVVVDRVGTGTERKYMYRIVETDTIERYSTFVKITEVYKEQLSRMKSKEEPPIIELPKITVPVPPISIICPHSPGYAENELKRKFDEREEEQKVAKRVKWTPDLCLSDIFRGNYVFI
jgi:hypothetical protein